MAEETSGRLLLDQSLEYCDVNPVKGGLPREERIGDEMLLEFVPGLLYKSPKEPEQ